MFTYYRIVILIVSFFALSALSSNYLIINLTFICMQDDLKDGMTSANQTLVSRYAYSPSEKSLIIWAVAIGTVIGTFPFNFAFIRWGAKIPFLIGGVLSIISTGLTPLAASLSLPFLLVLRLIQGIAYSADFSAIGVITLRWAPLDEMSIFIAVMTSFISFSTFITNSASAWFCTSSLGWRWAFYSHTIATVVIFSLWMLIYKDDPTKHKRVTRDELKKLQKDKTKAELEIDYFVPYTAILKNVSVWVLWLNGLALISSLTFLIIYMPMYLHDVLKFDVSTTGMLAAIGPLIHTLTKYVSGFFSDKVKIISENKKLQICNVLATGVPGILFVLIGLARHQWNGNFAIALIFGVFFTMAANCGGYWKATTLISRQYAHFVLSVIQFMKSVALFTAPIKWYLFIRNERGKLI
ncbi:unnamed protein product, partial [Mesorhabditis belari]|uniref:Major facilitator superfamily (MFS) profile domain-containing protein n=1 Tax=Mesorhabditis belari TaxID=2138241 RepID=A0AAF3J263_9BILA